MQNLYNYLQENERKTVAVKKMNCKKNIYISSFLHKIPQLYPARMHFKSKEQHKKRIQNTESSSSKTGKKKKEKHNAKTFWNRKMGKKGCERMRRRKNNGVYGWFGCS